MTNFMQFPRNAEGVYSESRPNSYDSEGGGIEMVGRTDRAKYQAEKIFEVKLGECAVPIQIVPQYTCPSGSTDVD